MDLKVIRYQNYGCTDSTVANNDPYDNNFYWSFYELSNKLIISLLYVENLKFKKPFSSSYEFTYAESKLKNGDCIKYIFGQDFFKWFNLNPSVNDLEELKYPNEKEKQCVKIFFRENILSYKEVVSDVMYVKN